MVYCRNCLYRIPHKTDATKNWCGKCGIEYYRPNTSIDQDLDCSHYMGALEATEDEKISSRILIKTNEDERTSRRILGKYNSLKQHRSNLAKTIESDKKDIRDAKKNLKSVEKEFRKTEAKIKKMEEKYSSLIVADEL